MLTSCKSDRDSVAAPPDTLSNTHRPGAKNRAHAFDRGPQSLGCRGRRQRMVTSSLVNVTGFRLFAKEGDAIGQIGIPPSFNPTEHVFSDGVDFLRSEKNARLCNVHALKVFANQTVTLRVAVLGIGVAGEVRHPGSRTTTSDGLHNLRLVEFRLA